MLNEGSWSESFGTPLNDLTRLLLISYFPSGFWSRLMIRILADTQIAEIAQKVYSDAENVSFPTIHFNLYLVYIPSEQLTMLIMLCLLPLVDHAIEQDLLETVANWS